MKKIALLVFIAAGIVQGCSTPAARQQAETTKEKKVCKFICTMDKDVCSDKPGTCPKCGMELVEKDNDK